MRAHSVFFGGGMGLCVLILASVSIDPWNCQSRSSFHSAGQIFSDTGRSGFSSANNLAILFAEDFEDGQAQGWDYNPALALLSLTILPARKSGRPPAWVRPLPTVGRRTGVIIAWCSRCGD